MLTTIDKNNLYIHIDRSLISILEYPQHNDDVSDKMKKISKQITAKYQTENNDIQYANEYGCRSQYQLENEISKIAIWFDRYFQNGHRSQKIEKPYTLAKIQVTHKKKDDYSEHHKLLLYIDHLLNQYVATRYAYVREIEIAADTPNPELGQRLFKQLCPYRASYQGWEFKRNGKRKIRRKRFLKGAIDQYYQSHVEREKKRDHKEVRQRQWHNYIHQYGDMDIWRMELRLYHTYLKRYGLWEHSDIISQIDSIYKQHVVLIEPDWDVISEEYPQYLRWYDYSSPALITAMRGANAPPSAYLRNKMLIRTALPSLIFDDRTTY